MTSWEQTTRFAGRNYRVGTQGNGLFLHVDREEPAHVGGKVGYVWHTVFHAQGDDASEFVDVLNRHGSLYLLCYLDSAGVELM